MRKTLEYEMEVPKVPNFILYKKNGELTPISVGEFSDEELEQIGNEWTKNLIKTAHEVRKR